MIVSLHGSGFTAPNHEAMIDAAELSRLGALVLTPQALIPFRYGDGFPAGFGWNVPGSPLPGEDAAREEPDDVGYVSRLLATIRRRHPTLPVHLLGYSGGARLASHVLASDRTPTSAGLVAGAVFPPTGAPAVSPLLVIHGRRDDVNPYGHGNGARWPTGIQRTTEAWAGAGAGAHLQELEPGVVEQRFAPLAPSGAVVRLISLDDVGHTWPGTDDSRCLRQFGPAGTWSATRHLSTFFAGFDRPAHPTEG